MNQKPPNSPFSNPCNDVFKFYSHMAYCHYSRLDWLAEQNVAILLTPGDFLGDSTV